MKKYIIIIFLLSFIVNANAQQSFGFGNQAAHSSAIFDVSKTTKGLLIPRLTQLQRITMPNPAEGLLVYDSTTHRLYQFQDGAWTYLSNNSAWLRLATGKFVYTFDSIGIGVTSPDKRLQVNGVIRARLGIRGNNISAAAMLQANDMTTPGNIAVNGGILVGGNATTKGSLISDDASPILQMDVENDNKVFMQVSSNDFRFGTNAGNPLGKMIIRMNGTDIISIDEDAGFKVLNDNSGGNLNVGPVLARNVDPDDNMLAMVTGRVNNDGTLRWCSDETAPPEVVRTAAGRYEIKFWGARITARAAILVTAGGTAPRIASAIFIGPPVGSYLKVEIYDPVNRTFADAEFSFIIHDPANLYTN